MHRRPNSIPGTESSLKEKEAGKVKQRKIEYKPSGEIFHVLSTEAPSDTACDDTAEEEVLVPSSPATEGQLSGPYGGHCEVNVLVRLCVLSFQTYIGQSIF